MPLADILEAHAKEFELTPSQQVNLLLYYLALQQLFPEITLETYLARTRNVAGATPENRQFPKDALDHHCPTKESAWKPHERLDIMLTYLELVAICREAGETPPSLDELLVDEAPRYKANFNSPADQADPVASPVPAAPKRSRSKRALASASEQPRMPPNLTAGSRALFRGPLGTGVGPERLGTVHALTPATATTPSLIDFQTDDGEMLTDQPLEYFSLPPAEAPTPEPVHSAANVTHYVSPADNTTAMAYLGAPAAIGGVPIGAALQTFEVVGVGPGRVKIQVCNAHPKPYIDAALVDSGGNTLVELPPRENSLLGDYHFPIPGGETYTVSVAQRN